MKPSKVNKRSRLKLGTYRGIWGVSKSKSPLTPREARAVIAIKKMYPGEHENAAFRRQLITELRDSVKDRVWHITEILRNTGTVGFSDVTWKTIVDYSRLLDVLPQEVAREIKASYGVDIRPPKK